MAATLSIVCFFCLIHLWGSRLATLFEPYHNRFLSFAGGVAVAYVFIDLLPALSAGENSLKGWAVSLFFEKHVYLLALLGLLMFYGAQLLKGSTPYVFWLRLGAYALFNFLIGYVVADPSDVAIQPLWLFAVAMGLHYFVNDNALRESHPMRYQSQGRFWLIFALLAGWATGEKTKIPQAAVDIAISFIAGGVMMNTFQRELPNPANAYFSWFFLGSFIYTLLILSF